MVAAVESMAYAGQVPWHGLGKRVPMDLSPQQMLETAGLDWTVSKVPGFAEINGEKRDLGWSALVRDSDQKILDIVSNDWNPNQNIDAFAFFDEFVRTGNMQMHTAGSLRGGQVVWALAKISESFAVFGDDQIDSYLLFTNPHRFGQSIDVRFTPIRVVCWNTISLALSTKGKNVVSEGDESAVRVNHRSAFDAAKVKETLGIASFKLNKYREAAEFIGSRRYTDQSLERYFKEVFPKVGAKENDQSLSRNASLAISLMETQPGAKFAEGTFWQAFNAATFIIDHKVGRSDDTRLASAWYGQGRGTKITALNKAVEYANAA